MKKVLFLLPAIITALFASSCLQANYEGRLQNYIPSPASDISGTFSIDDNDGRDMLIITLNGGTFQEKLESGYFVLQQGTSVINLNVPLRDSDNRVIFSFDLTEALTKNNYSFLVKKEAIKDSASKISMQAVKGGIWTIVQNIEGIFGRSVIYGITYGNGRFAAVADEGKMAYSGDGLTWTAIRPGYGVMQSSFTNTIRGITYGDNKFIAVGYDSRMAASDNGINWNGWSESMFDGQSILCITYGGGRFVAAGDNGRMIYMQDGGNWTNVQDSRFGEKSILALTYGNPNGINVYVAAGQDGQLAWSNDAVSWNYADSQFSGLNIFGLAYGNNCFVAGGDQGRISRSLNGSDWNLVPVNAFDSNGIQSIAFGSGVFIAAGHNGKMLKSSDGETWTIIESGEQDNQNQFSSRWQIQTAAYGGGKFVAAGQDYFQELNSRIVLSYQPPEVVKAPQNIDSSPFNCNAGDNKITITLSGGKFADSLPVNSFSVLSGIGSGGFAEGALNGSIIERGDERIIIRMTNPAPSNGTGQQIRASSAAFAQQFSSVNLSISCEKMYRWVEASSNPFGTSNISAIAHNGSNVYIAVGAGKIARSGDGISWTEIPDISNQWSNSNNYIFFKDITYGGGKFAAVGYWAENADNDNRGWGVTAVSSDNGATWTITDKILTLLAESISPQVYAVTHDGDNPGIFFAAGQWGRLAYSTDGINWTSVQIPFNYLSDPFYYEDILALAYDGTHLIAGSTGGKIFYSTDKGLTWTWIADELLGYNFDITAFCYGSGTIIAAGTGGNMKTIPASSINFDTGSLWQGVDSKFADSGILSVAYNGSRFVAAGHNGKMSESADGSSWTAILPGSQPEQTKFSEREQISCIYWDGNKFIAGGNEYDHFNNKSKLIYSE